MPLHNIIKHLRLVRAKFEVAMATATVQHQRAFAVLYQHIRKNQRTARIIK